MGRTKAGIHKIISGYYRPKVQKAIKRKQDAEAEERFLRRRAIYARDQKERDDRKHNQKIERDNNATRNKLLLENNKTKQAEIRSKNATKAVKAREKTRTNESKKRTDYRANKTIATEATKMHMHGKEPDLTPPKRRKKKNGKK